MGFDCEGRKVHGSYIKHGTRRVKISTAHDLCTNYTTTADRTEQFQGSGHLTE